MYDLTSFKMSDMIECGAALRHLNDGAQSMHDVASRVVRYLYDQFGDADGNRACALVRFYKTHAYGQLGPDLQAFAHRLMGAQPETPEMKCLTLLGSAGENAAWNDPGQSAGHRAIPLPSQEVVAKIPMIARLIQQFGMEISEVVTPGPSLIMELDQKTYNVLYVPEALGSPFIPVQDDFVIPYGIRSVLGFGGMLPSGDLFAIIIFSKAHLPRQVTELFKTLSLSVKMAVLPFVDENIFAS